MKNFIKFPEIKFRKCLLHFWAKEKYINAENRKQDRVDRAYARFTKLYTKKKVSKAEKINLQYNFDIVATSLYNLIKIFTYKEFDKAVIQEFIDTLKIAGIEAEVNGGILHIKSEEISFFVKKLSKVEPAILKMLPDIEEETRGGKCHPYGVITALAYNKNKNFDTYFVTGKIYHLSAQGEYLHSWVEIADETDTFVIDPTRNAIYSKEAFYMINHVKDTIRLHSSVVQQDYKLIRELTNYDSYLAKVYYENPENGRKLHNELVKLGEIPLQENQK
ncbi:MAG: hypothetical protein J6J33_04105 [Clostridia bacterium]|nr:hypothetical protein [Clostridia bacterium]